MNINVTEVQLKAMELVGVSEPSKQAELVETAMLNALRSKLNYTRNGTKLPEDRTNEATHQVKDTKTGKTSYYKGGLKSDAANTYKSFVSAMPVGFKVPMTEAEFVAAQLKAIDDVISALSAKGTVKTEGDDANAE